jgi:hypothetical protein
MLSLAIGAILNGPFPLNAFRSVYEYCKPIWYRPYLPMNGLYHNPAVPCSRSVQNFERRDRRMHKPAVR